MIPHFSGIEIIFWCCAALSLVGMAAIFVSVLRVHNKYKRVSAWNQVLSRIVVCYGFLQVSTTAMILLLTIHACTVPEITALAAWVAAASVTAIAFIGLGRVTRRKAVGIAVGSHWEIVLVFLVCLGWIISCLLLLGFSILVVFLSTYGVGVIGIGLIVHEMGRVLYNRAAKERRMLAIIIGSLALWISIVSGISFLVMWVQSESSSILVRRATVAILGACVATVLATALRRDNNISTPSDVRNRLASVLPIALGLVCVLFLVRRHIESRNEVSAFSLWCEDRAQQKMAATCPPIEARMKDLAEVKSLPEKTDIGNRCATGSRILWLEKGRLVLISDGENREEVALGRPESWPGVVLPLVQKAGAVRPGGISIGIDKTSRWGYVVEFFQVLAESGIVNVDILFRTKADMTPGAIPDQVAVIQQYDPLENPDDQVMCGRLLENVAGFCPELARGRWFGSMGGVDERLRYAVSVLPVYVSSCWADMDLLALEKTLDCVLDSYSVGLASILIGRGNEIGLKEVALDPGMEWSVAIGHLMASVQKGSPVRLKASP